MYVTESYLWRKSGMHIGLIGIKQRWNSLTCLSPIVIDKVLSEYSLWLYTRIRNDEPNFLTPYVFWNITDFGAKCQRCRR